jgi:5-carboxymethyl-2-hydroxymuconate isomerase
MINVTVTYTDNLGPEADIPALVAKLAQKVREVAPSEEPVMVGALRLTEYALAGEGDWDALSAVVKVPAAQVATFRDGLLSALFSVADIHFAELYSRRAVALSFELASVSEDNVIERFHRRAPTADTF